MILRFETDCHQNEGTIVWNVRCDSKAHGASIMECEAENNGPFNYWHTASEYAPVINLPKQASPIAMVYERNYSFYMNELHRNEQAEDDNFDYFNDPIDHVEGFLGNL